eukprot:TRINITY_DN3380_c0_g1_i2.p1 TRINITY_DN3380_c0_g1~~TRINITY_DN3380_c0_g1_i2.p1  ORF type:complete len:580 (-),score=103.89 TRINITY_DN3380_c0_g1_i2:116-1855(-)
MFDCGMHMGYHDERRFPNFGFISHSGKFDEVIDCVIVTHFHLDHSGALPFFTEMCGYNGPIYMTHPTKAIVPILLEDYRKITVERKGETNFFTSQMIKDCMKKVIPINLHQTIWVDDELEIKAYYAGHVLGAAMFYARVKNTYSVLYTGDYNMTPDRHLGSARVEDKIRPDILITETTYATTIRDSKRMREGNFLKRIHSCVERGGKVLIPVFALGRAQELCILIETYWERMGLEVPIYFSAGMTEKANMYYKLFINWTNQKIKSTFVQRNMFDFKHISPFEKSWMDNPGPMVLFATPGMLHAGTSLEVFKKWCTSELNMCILPGYCVSGTVGNKILAGRTSIDIDSQKLDIRCKVHSLSFSAHADSKGILQLIEQVDPANVVLVHGERGKMRSLKARIYREYGRNCYDPANGECITINASHPIPADLSLNLLQNQFYNGEESIIDPKPLYTDKEVKAVIVMHEDSSIEILDPNEAASSLNLQNHTILCNKVIMVPQNCNPQKLFNTTLPHLQMLAPNYEVDVQNFGENMIQFNTLSIVFSPSPAGSFQILATWRNAKDDDMADVFLNEIETLIKQQSV